jgi:hypothetical protein
MARIKDQNDVALRKQLAAELTAAMKEKGVGAPRVSKDLGLNEGLNFSPNAIRGWSTGRFGPPEPARLELLGNYFGREFLTDSVQLEADSNSDKSEEPFTIAIAKRKLAAAFGVAEDRVEITIRG